MSNIKHAVSKFHQNTMDLTIIVFIAIIWITGIYEAYMLTTFQFIVYKTNPTWFDYTANAVPIILGSFSAMFLPKFVEEAKSKFSVGGTEIVFLELAIIVFLACVAIVVPFFMYYKMLDALDECLKLKAITPSAYELRLSTVIITVGSNFMVDLLVGFYAYYEVQREADNLRVVKLGGIKTKSKKAIKVEAKEEEPEIKVTNTAKLKDSAEDESEKK